ncbi:MULTISPECIES: TOBE domain-containing protein [Sulfurimonas]|uniref:TOBE domain-containing protein n=1 Tax=Sulfurimonas diazotrophicus TaxID=3131939 RepID=A0ABZ3H9Z6_9BACT
MNKIAAVVTDIERTDIVTYITLQCNETQIRLIKTKTPVWAGVGDKVCFSFQEASVCVSKECPGKVSIENRIPGTLKKIRSKDSLCELTFESDIGTVVSLITEKACHELGLEVGCDATMLLRGVDIHLEPDVVPMTVDSFKKRAGTKVAP